MTKHQINHLHLKQKNWVEIHDDYRTYKGGTYKTGSQIRFTTTMLKSILCDYSDAYILVKGNIKVNNTGTAPAPANRNKKSNN